MERATERLLHAKTVVSWTNEAGKRQKGSVICLGPIPPRNDDGSIRADLATYRLHVFQTVHGRRMYAGFAYKYVTDLTVETLPVTVAGLKEGEDL